MSCGNLVYSKPISSSRICSLAIFVNTVSCSSASHSSTEFSSRNIRTFPNRKRDASFAHFRAMLWLELLERLSWLKMLQKEVCHSTPKHLRLLIHRKKRKAKWRKIRSGFLRMRTWYTAPRGPIPPPTSVQRGPFRVSQLLDMVRSGEISGETLVAPSVADSDEGENFHNEVDTGKWNSLASFFQLRTQMLAPGKVVYSPAEIGHKAITLLSNLSALHRSTNSLGAPFYPTPISKRLMSNPDHLAVFAQLLLCNDRSVVNTAAQLLQSLVDYNILANSKLYGFFFFVFVILDVISLQLMN